MRSMIRQSLVLLALCCMATAAGAAPEGGTESNLGLGVGSRGLALGGAFLARADDASAVFWNPAAMVQLERGHATLMHAPIGFGDAALSFAGVVYPTPGAGSFGLGYQRLGTGGIQSYDASSQPQGEIGFAESAFYFAYAARLPAAARRVSVGATAKILNQSLGTWSATGAGLDLGLVFDLPVRGDLALACVLRDAVAPQLQLDLEADAAPARLGLAASYRLPVAPEWNLRLHAGGEHQRFLGWSPQLGLECSVRGRLQLRAGVSRLGAAFGFGLGWSNYGLDYTYLGQSESATHPVSLAAHFGPTRAERQASARARAQAAREAELRAELQAMVEAKLQTAQAAYERGDYATALDGWKLVAELDPSDERAARGMQASGTRLAEEQARSLADQTHAAAGAAQFELGLRYYGASEYVLARNVWQELLRQDPANAEAKRYLEKSVEALRQQVRHHAEAAREAERRGDWVGALVAWNLVRGGDARHPELEPALARCRTALEGAEARRNRTSPASKPAPSLAPVPATPKSGRYPEALQLYSAGETARAAALLREVLRLDPEHQAAAELLSRAERQLRPLSAEDKTRVRELYLRGMAHFTSNEFEAAIAEWSKILALDPGNTSVHQNIDAARSRLEAMQRTSGAANGSR